MSNFEEQKGLFMSLLYLQSEARHLKMSNTEKSIKDAIEALFFDMNLCTAETEQLASVKLFLDKILAMPPENIQSFIATLELFEVETIQ